MRAWSVATTTSAAPLLAACCATRTTIGRPAMSASGLSGRRVECSRAGITTRNSATAHLFVGGQFARFAFQHHRNAVANRKSQAIGLADQFLGGLVKHQRAFADRADENFKQLAVHGAVLSA